MLLTSYPTLYRLNTITAAKTGFTRLVNVFVMRAIFMAAKDSGAASEASILVTFSMTACRRVFRCLLR
ncbi:transposase (fragment) [Vibrio crassostreae]|uniref:Transposase n=1 Tax=Vibrio crassostreae TaxID=246167 RepID=A0A822MN36_9VIBR|nr:hypothetical protein EDB52_1352 [Vibrio crassostreae]TCM98713.1 hypothetical protein EDB35_1502 [Vibrio crassostreae]TCT41206.1 hypothetical protein EDB39_1412 [Vibrio crassostreae]TCT45548.1 hypothetical protein EDB42_1312 [Vibrio crassostreae]TCT69212.1 hypothetical protein EDB41_1312 [Vibrio crassostreae]